MYSYLLEICMILVINFLINNQFIKILDIPFLNIFENTKNKKLEIQLSFLFCKNINFIIIISSDMNKIQVKMLKKW